VDRLVMSELSLERTSQGPRMQGQSPFLGAWKGVYHEGQSQQKVCIQCLVTCPFGQAHVIEGGPCARTAVAPWEVNLLSCFLSKQLVLVWSGDIHLLLFLGTTWSCLATVNPDPPVHREG